MQPAPKRLSWRFQTTNIIYVLLWVAEVILIFMKAPFWLVLSVGGLGGYFAFRDWRTIRALARTKINPPHPNPDIQDLIDGKIEISEFRRRKERKTEMQDSAIER